MKTLVTHINPHLDDISAIWLFRKFFKEFNDAKFEFISASRDSKAQESQDKIFIGTGGGKFDEHKGDIGECATTLVWNEIKAQGLTPKDEFETKALEELIEWNRRIDTGMGNECEMNEYSIQNYLRPRDGKPESSGKAVILGEQILNRLLFSLKAKYQTIKDWEESIEFNSEFGRSFAVKSEVISRDFCRDKDAKLFLMYDPKRSSVQFFTPSLEIDLEPLFLKLKQRDSKASWYLHHSHHIILCGSGSAPEFIPTSLSFEQLIEIARTN